MKFFNVENLGLIFGRKKKVSLNETTKLHRSLNIIQLTILGMGATMGAGVYVCVAEVAREKSGPLVIFSFIIAALACILSGLCYAEFGARIPQVGSAYLFSYVALGELVAFIMGISLVVQFTFGGASVAKAWSDNIDGMTNGQISTYMREYLPINVEWFASYPDFLAVFAILMISGFFLLGARTSTISSNIFTGVTVCVLITIFIAGITKANLSNWHVDPEDVLSTESSAYSAKDLGNGGLFPFGFQGVMEGACLCFFALIGFDSISVASGEARNPQRDIPLAIILCVVVCFLFYSGISLSLTLMVPYYMMERVSPLSTAFRIVELIPITYVVSIGSFCSTTSSLMAQIFSLPRVLYSIADDGLIFKFFARLSTKTKIPYVAMVLSALIMSFSACIFDKTMLADISAAATLTGYALVATSVNILRYKQHGINVQDILMEDTEKFIESKKQFSDTIDEEKNPRNLKLLMKLIFKPSSKLPTETSEHIIKVTSILVLFFNVSLCIGLIFLTIHQGSLRIFGIVLSIMSTIILIVLTVAQFRQPQNTFKVPLVPLVPNLSIFINLYIAATGCKPICWVIYLLILVPGICIYLIYGIKNSKLNKDLENNCSLSQSEDFA